MNQPQPQELAVDNVCVSFGQLKACDVVSFKISQGETLGLIGPNGSGKTTMVNVITGFQRPTSGRVRIGDRDITRLRPEARVAAGVSRTFQAVRLFGRLTVAENIEVGARGVGASRRVARDRATQLMEQLGLDHLSQVQSSSLPYGSERRVALARALATDPKFMLLDEPAAGLDESETDDLASALIDVRDTKGCGLLVIEHDMRLITKVCNQVHVLAAGRTLAVGEPQVVVRDPAVVEAYLGAEAPHVSS
ncbi:ABC transporter ATP-binding protein [Arthrobacter sp. MI7-26]|uniref:ABC transporter ATP-binding protein n=1 Tax=Arthrobacter sp. MI7-26 TaxID=2993653 RepID=UPI0022497D71|nr:ABC transporter ATP-binding protein [Arthrobacter sp. MI7-26]MCX2750061.1 ABC transporter ATP-binding protein [Arthrobacter sp. MI7-26]